MVDDNPLLPPAAEPHGTAADRLNSWKEIAGYLSKGVRTVQRWEAQMGLPVRRLGREGGEIVYGLRSEIDAWILKGGKAIASDALPAVEPTATEEPLPAPIDIATPAPPPPSPTRKTALRWLWGAPVVIGLIGLAMTGGQGAMMRAGAPSGPAPSSSLSAQPGDATGANPIGASFESGMLTAWSVESKVIWTMRIRAGIDDRLDTRIPLPAGRIFTRIAVADLEGDGRNEVLLLTNALSGSGDSLRVFNSDGSPRFMHTPGRPVTYGSEVYPGYNANGIHLLHDGDESPELWLTAANVSLFPSILQRISATGEVMSDYWSNGHIMSVRPATLRGRPFLLVGAYHNETRGGSLAILDRERATGTAPADTAAYRCLDCAEGTPVEFLVFPRADITKEMTQGQGTASVIDARLVGQTNLVITVNQMGTKIPGESEPVSGTLNYTLSVEDLQLRAFLPGWGFLAIHKEFHRAGRLNHAFGPAEEAELKGILRWDGTRFVPLSESRRELLFARDRKPPSGRSRS